MLIDIFKHISWHRLQVSLKYVLRNGSVESKICLSIHWAMQSHFQKWLYPCIHFSVPLVVSGFFFLSFLPWLPSLGLINTTSPTLNFLQLVWKSYIHIHIYILRILYILKLIGIFNFLKIITEFCNINSLLHSNSYTLLSTKES